jgi:hypothetical protein
VTRARSDIVNIPIYCILTTKFILFHVGWTDTIP